MFKLKKHVEGYTKNKYKNIHQIIIIINYSKKIVIKCYYDILIVYLYIINSNFNKG